jgi:2-polyprenyl-6-methoxyphenol hydroxylase-like FAD-dependent oxidoreductase
MVCPSSHVGLIEAHNLAWKLAEVINGQSADPEKLLDSYTEEVQFLLKSSLIIANPNHSQYNWAHS